MLNAGAHVGIISKTLKCIHFQTISQNQQYFEAIENVTAFRKLLTKRQDNAALSDHDVPIQNDEIPI